MYPAMHAAPLVEVIRFRIRSRYMWVRVGVFAGITFGLFLFCKKMTLLNLSCWVNVIKCLLIIFRGDSGRGAGGGAEGGGGSRPPNVWKTRRTFSVFSCSSAQPTFYIWLHLLAPLPLQPKNCSAVLKKCPQKTAFTINHLYILIRSVNLPKGAGEGQLFIARLIRLISSDL